MAIAELNMMDACIDDLINIAREEEVDYIIYDACCIWAKYIAQSLGIPGINSLTTIVSSPWIPLSDLNLGLNIAKTLAFGAPRIIPWARRLLIDIFDRSNVTYKGLFYHIFDVFACVGDLNIVFNTPEYQPFVDKLEGNFHFVGASVPERRDEISEEFLNIGKKPLVYVSLGTLHNSSLEFFKNCIEALRDRDYEVIMSIGNAVKLEDLGPLPDNFKVYPYVPQLHILKHASAFVTHGGMNSLNEGLYFGVPVVVCPQQFEQAFNGRRLQKMGVAKTLANSLPRASKIREGVEAVINEPLMKERTEAYGQVLKAAGGYKRAAELIIDYTKRSEVPDITAVKKAQAVS
jgi:MGT family glycosyltransferase